MTYRIYSLINPGTGEIVPFTDDLVTQVAEIQRAIDVAITQARAERTIRIVLNDEQPKLTASGEELAKALFEQE